MKFPGDLNYLTISFNYNGPKPTDRGVSGVSHRESPFLDLRIDKL